MNEPDLHAEIARLQRLVLALAERCYQQAELLARRAERAPDERYARLKAKHRLVCRWVKGLLSKDVSLADFNERTRELCGERR